MNAYELFFFNFRLMKRDAFFYSYTYIHTNAHFSHFFVHKTKLLCSDNTARHTFYVAQ